MIIYGIKNCDKVRAAMKQAQTDDNEVRLHDFRVNGIDADLVKAMLQDIEFKHLLNKRSTTWKQLSASEQVAADSQTLVSHPTLIKRPVVFVDGQYRIGL
ncbi:arsenate reductase [Marinicella sp. S1101]|uniref:ArsC/Spx/MgsR family protein n=1 Tax=Marinicella marina TaxID=2996016 RepID=UPI002260DBAA|nr:ArsC/Spx/MgsR family protein [Marinicella marina]MCX7554577.1 arsenate reductase [Marinicella marina]MDJ1141039.1 ArsC/Spx/MgsR family protein [Marinicella marina]